MYSRKLDLPQNKSFFLFGPRGVGKSTWIRLKYPEARYLDLLDSHIYTQLLTNPGELVDFIPTNWQKYVIIDEVQRVPELLNEVHRLIENNKYKFILTGSSARKLRRGGVNLLAGRALNYSLHPLTAIEMGEDFKLKDSLQFG